MTVQKVPSINLGAPPLGKDVFTTNDSGDTSLIVSHSKVDDDATRDQEEEVDDDATILGEIMKEDIIHGTAFQSTT